MLKNKLLKTCLFVVLLLEMAVLILNTKKILAADLPFKKKENILKIIDIINTKPKEESCILENNNTEINLKKNVAKSKEKSVDIEISRRALLGRDVSSLFFQKSLLSEPRQYNLGNDVEEKNALENSNPESASSEKILPGNNLTQTQKPSPSVVMPKKNPAAVPQKINNINVQNGPKVMEISGKVYLGGIGKLEDIATKVKKVGGKRTCANKNDHPSNSDKNKRWHVDSECCLDKDEIPNAKCYYSEKKYGRLIQKYLNKINEK